MRKRRRNLAARRRFRFYALVGEGKTRTQTLKRSVFSDVKRRFGSKLRLLFFFLEFRFRDDFLLDVPRNDVVTVELDRVTPLTAGHTGQRAVIGRNFGERNFRFDRLEPAARVFDAQRTTAARRDDVGVDVPDFVDRNGDVEVDDRFEEGRTRFHKGDFERVRGRRLERLFVTVDRVVFPEVDFRAKVLNVETGDDAAFHTFFKALVDRRHKVRRNRAADDGVDPYFQSFIDGKRSLFVANSSGSVPPGNGYMRT